MDLLLVTRGLMALAVVVWHAEGYQGDFPSLLNVPGRTAVWIFFGISGYVIAYGFIHRRYNLTGSDLRDFYLNRFLRIYPLFLALSILSWITEMVLTGNSPISLNDLPAQLFAVQFNHSYVLSGVFWTLGVELHFYLLAPLLVLPLLIKNTTQALLIAISVYLVVIVGYGYAIKNFGWSYDGRNIVANLPHFLTGMIACRVVSTIGPSAIRSWIAVATVCVVLGLSNSIYHNYPNAFWAGGGMLTVDVIIFLLVVAHASVDFRKDSPPPGYFAFAFLGTLSYGVYAQHAYLITYVPWLSDKIILLILSSIALAYLSYRLIEVPALRLKRRHSPIPAIS